MWNWESDSSLSQKKQQLADHSVQAELLKLLSSSHSGWLEGGRNSSGTVNLLTADCLCLSLFFLILSAGFDCVRERRERPGGSVCDWRGKLLNPQFGSATYFSPPRIPWVFYPWFLNFFIHVGFINLIFFSYRSEINFSVALNFLVFNNWSLRKDCNLWKKVFICLMNLNTITRFVWLRQEIYYLCEHLYILFALTILDRLGLKDISILFQVIEYQHYNHVHALS